jgi:formate dehydrogenase iron-sulfur subunit
MIGILVDVAQCSGCNQCIDACAVANGLGSETPQPQQCGDGLSAQRWAAIVHSPEGRHVRKFCRHCLEPACVSVCPVGAMVKTAEGPVIYDGQKCMGCRYCMMACPFGIPRYEWDSAAPLVRKCTLCYQRLQAGQLPACVEACPNQALVFGERDELLRQAHQKIQAEPGKYLPVVFGEKEAGGTSVLYLSDVPLDFNGGVGGFHGDPGQTPLPELSANWLGKVPALSIATASLMTGLFWIIGRRIQMEEARAARQNKEA